MRKFLRILVALILVALAYWGWRALFPSPVKVIRGRLIELAQTASFPPSEPALTKLANARKITSFFTEDVTIALNETAFGKVTVRGSENLFQGYAQVRQQMNGLKLEFLDVNVTLGPDKTTAVANLTGKATIPGQRDLMVEELNIMFKKVNGKWLIYRVESVQAFSQKPTLRNLRFEI